jgi:uncharacterized protein YabN with tetrapyrrole methylase and pyrophosphatase domain
MTRELCPDEPVEAGNPGLPHGGTSAFETSWAIQERVSKRGFDWPDISGVLAKVREEAGEIEQAVKAGDGEGAKRELGDLLFATVNLARFLDADPVAVLEEASGRFVQRFALLEVELDRSGRRMEACTLAELDEVWERVKARLRVNEAKPARTG